MPAVPGEQFILAIRMAVTMNLFLFLALVLHANGDGRPPSIVEQPREKVIYFMAGDPVELKCAAEGDPLPKQAWTRNGQVITPSSDSNDRIVQRTGEGTIVITETEAADEGIYQCLAKNSHGVSLSDKVELIQAMITPYEYPGPEEEDLTVTVGHPLTLNCVPPDSKPPAIVFWVTEHDNTFQQVIYDNRVTVDHDFSRLRFTHVLPEDRANGHAYVCMAQNYVLRSMFTLSPKFRINPVNEGAEQRPADMMWSSPSDLLALLGDSLVIQCIFSGNPAPTVTWTRTDGQPLPDHAVFQDYGRELRIDNVQYGDNGTYQCVGTNEMTETPVARSISVRVEARPYLLSNLTDVEVEVGGGAEFNCLAGGVPAPAYLWYFNGVPLENVTDPWIMSGRFQIPDDHRIVFTDLTLNDSMVVQCNATNRHGYIWSDVSFTVLYENPTTATATPGPV